MARRCTPFDIATQPRRVRRVWVRRAWRAARFNNKWEKFSLREAWQAWDVQDCGPMTWSKVISKNYITCKG